MCGVFRPPFCATPNVSTYCDQFVTSVALLTGPAGAKPTNAAIAVPTPSIGRGPLLTSSIYTPGDKYSAMMVTTPQTLSRFAIEHDVVRLPRHLQRHPPLLFADPSHRHGHLAFADAVQHKPAVDVADGSITRVRAVHEHIGQRAAARIANDAADVNADFPPAVVGCEPPVPSRSCEHQRGLDRDRQFQRRRQHVRQGRTRAGAERGPQV